MADETKTAKQSDSNVKEVAFELFKNCQMNTGSPEQLAIKCFRNAAVFLKTAEAIASKKIDLSAIDNNPLDEAYCPNLKKTFPDNMASRQWGNLKRVLEICEILEKNPMLESIEDLGWGKPEVNRARILFPAVAKRQRELETSAN